MKNNGNFSQKEGVLKEVDYHEAIFNSALQVPAKETEFLQK